MTSSFGDSSTGASLFFWIADLPRRVLWATRPLSFVCRFILKKKHSLLRSIFGSSHIRGESIVTSTVEETNCLCGFDGKDFSMPWLPPLEG